MLDRFLSVANGLISIPCVDKGSGQDSQGFGVVRTQLHRQTRMVQCSVGFLVIDQHPGPANVRSRIGRFLLCKVFVDGGGVFKLTAPGESIGLGK